MQKYFGIFWFLKERMIELQIKIISLVHLLISTISCGKYCYKNAKRISLRKYFNFCLLRNRSNYDFETFFPINHKISVTTRFPNAL